MKFNLFILPFILTLFELHASEERKVPYHFIYPIKISEVCSNNNNIIRDEKGNYEDWFELHNYGDKPINLNGFYLTDNINYLKKHKIYCDSSQIKKLNIYPGSYIIFWCDKETGQGPKHTNFKLNANGDFLALVAPDGITIIDSITLPALPEDISVGKFGNSNKKVFYQHPSPKKKNNTPYLSLCENDISVPQSGFYYHPKTFQINAKKIELTINAENKDTFDNRLTYTIDSTYTAQYKILDENCAGKKTKYRTYFFGIQHSIPVISIHIDTNHLWNKFYGIHYGRNYKRKLIRNAYFEYFDEKGKLKEKAEIEINIHGAYSKSYPQKSLAIKISDDSKNNYLKHTFFKKRKNNKFKSLILRNSGNDWLSARMRDILIQSMIEVEYLDLNNQAFEPCILYLNGHYWGLYYLREKISSDYLRYTYDIKKKDIDIIEKYKTAVKGNNKQFKILTKLINSNSSFKTDKQLTELSDLIDLDNFIDYQALQIYIGNQDWPQNNTKIWLNKNGKWRWIVYDLDEAFKNPELPSIDLALGIDSNRIKNFDTVYTRATTILPKLINNNEVREKIVNRIFDLMNFTFDSSRVAKHTDSIVEILKPHITNTLNYWYPKHSMLSKLNANNYFKSWLTSTQKLKNYTPKRNNNIIEQLKEHHWIKDTITFNIEFNKDHHKVWINGIEVQDASQKFIYSKNFGATVYVKPKEELDVSIPNKNKEHSYKIKRSGTLKID